MLISAENEILLETTIAKQCTGGTKSLVSVSDEINSINQGCVLSFVLKIVHVLQIYIIFERVNISKV